MGYVSDIKFEPIPEGASGSRFRVDKTIFFIPLEQAEGLEEKRQKIEEELTYLKGFLASVQKKLSNERFVSNAPEKVVALERKKAEDAAAKIEVLTQQLEQLS